MYEEARGEHYQSAYQHWDLAVDLNMNHLEGSATKYIARWDKPTGQGVKDLKKAVNYISKFIESIQTGVYTKTINECYGTSFSSDSYCNGVTIRKNHEYEKTYLGRFCSVNNVGSAEKVILETILYWEDVGELLMAKKLVVDLIHRAEAEAAL